MTIGERIKQARKDAKMTQRELAEKLKISYVGISQYERGIRTPKLDTLKKIADALGTDVNFLMSGKTLEQRDKEFIRKLQDYVDSAYNMSARIQQLREKHGLSYSEMSQKTGIPEQTIKRYEKGILNPKAKDLQLIALSLGESVGALLGYGDDHLTTVLIAEHPDDVVILDERGAPHFYYEETLEQQKQLDSLFMKLNKEGQQEAIKRIEDLTYNPIYQKNKD